MSLFCVRLPYLDGCLVLDFKRGPQPHSENCCRLKPYLQVHEFETLLFSRPEYIVQVLRGTDTDNLNLQRARQAFSSVEEINDGSATSPSHRIRALFPHYDKVLHGPQIVKRVGLQIIRESCPHFNAWLTWLESL